MLYCVLIWKPAVTTTPSPHACSRPYALPDVPCRCAVGDGLFVPEGQLFTVAAEHGVEVLLRFGECPNHTWPESRSYGASHHAERVLRYSETPVATL